MKYEIGEYGLTLKKAPIHYLWYVEDSVEGNFGTYEEAVERIREKMRSDKETGRQDENLKRGHLIVYFTAGWEDHSCTLKMHAAGTYDNDQLKLIRNYDDRIIVEEV